MLYKKVTAGASLVLLAFIAVPAACAANDGDGSVQSAPSSSTPSSSAPSQATHTAKPHRVIDPAKRAALRAKRQAKREARRQARQQQIRGAAPN